MCRTSFNCLSFFLFLAFFLFLTNKTKKRITIFERIFLNNFYNAVLFFNENGNGRNEMKVCARRGEKNELGRIEFLSRSV